MLIPRFSLRWLLGLITVCAVLSLVLAAAVRGDLWAVGAAAAVASLPLLALLHVIAFGSAWLIARVEIALFGERKGSSPFGAPPGGPKAAPAADSPPPLMG